MKKKKLLLILIFLITFLVSAFLAIKFSHKLIKKKERSDNLIEKVGKLIELPANQTPVLGTVTDKEKIKDQSFFSRAENGDRVLIFSEAKRVILYRPSTNKIIEVSYLKTSF